MGLDKLNHWVGSRKQATRALKCLIFKLFGKIAAGEFKPRTEEGLGGRRLNDSERNALEEKGMLPVVRQRREEGGGGREGGGLGQTSRC